MKLSIIIPAYNVESTLKRCVDSVERQHVDDSEIIIVDDGSTDKTPALCDELARENSKITVVHQRNGGLSAARNAGINIATGDYITFVDSDDIVDQDTYKPILNQLAKNRQVDILEYPLYHFVVAPEPERFDLERKEYTDADEYWLKAKAYCHTYACNKIFKRELFDDVRFPEGHVFEDVRTLPKLMAKAKVIATTDKGHYWYMYNPNGITATARGKELKDLLEAHLQYIAAGHKVDSEYYVHVLNIQMDVYEATGLEPEMPLMPYFKNIKLIVLHLIGLKNICKLNKLIHKTIGRRHS